MIELRNVKPGGERDILVFEVFIPTKRCLLRNVKLRVSQKQKLYVVYPCMVEDRPDGTKRYPRLAEFDEETENDLKNDVIPLLRQIEPAIMSRYA